MKFTIRYGLIIVCLWVLAILALVGRWRRYVGYQFADGDNSCLRREMSDYRDYYGEWPESEQ